jgi:hypothetical protein
LIDSLSHYLPDNENSINSSSSSVQKTNFAPPYNNGSTMAADVNFSSSQIHYNNNQHFHELKEMEKNQQQCIFNKDKVKLNGKEFVIYIFHATQAYAKAQINLRQFQNLSDGNINTTMENSTAAYFGEDIEILLELSKQMEFNVELTQAYGNFYGLKVSKDAL